MVGLIMLSQTFIADTDHLAEMLNYVEEFGEELKIPEPGLKKIVIAVEEVLVNVIHYAYPKKRGSICIECKPSSTKTGLCVVIEDEGSPFDPTKYPLPEIPSMDHIGGLGVYIFMHLMDEVIYERIDNKNRLSLTKFI